MSDTLNSEKSKSNEFKSQTSLQSNSSGQTEFTSPSAPTSTVNSDLANSFNSLKLSFKSNSNPSTSKQSSIKKATKAEQSEMAESSQSSTEPNVNSKLPPLKHPKAKIVVKKTSKEKNHKEISRENFDSLNTLESHSNSNGYKSDREEQPPTANGKQQQPNQQQHKIQRSTSSSVIEKRSSNSKSRPNSGNTALTPLYKKLRPVEDPILQILDQVRKILFISQVKYFTYSFESKQF